VAWKKRERGNEQGTVAPRRNKTGKITSYVVAIRTGLGRGELLGPKWVDLDLDAGTLSVRHAKLNQVDVASSGTRPSRVRLIHELNAGGYAARSSRG
jgi:integrase